MEAHDDAVTNANPGGDTEWMREISMKKLAVRISAVGGGLVAILLAGGANVKFK